MRYEVSLSCGVKEDMRNEGYNSRSVSNMQTLQTQIAWAAAQLIQYSVCAIYLGVPCPALLFPRLRYVRAVGPANQTNNANGCSQGVSMALRIPSDTLTAHVTALTHVNVEFWTLDHKG